MFFFTTDFPPILISSWPEHFLGGKQLGRPWCEMLHNSGNRKFPIKIGPSFVHTVYDAQPLRIANILCFGGGRGGGVKAVRDLTQTFLKIMETLPKTF